MKKTLIMLSIVVAGCANGPGMGNALGTAGTANVGAGVGQAGAAPGMSNVAGAANSGGAPGQSGASGNPGAGMGPVSTGGGNGGVGPGSSGAPASGGVGGVPDIMDAAGSGGDGAVAGAGGTSSSGSGGEGAGEAGSSAGGAGSGAMASEGCGAPTPLESGTFTLDVNGTERTYVLDVPESYDTNHAYRLVFTWHWLGGSAEDVVNQGYYGLKEIADETAIFVSPDGLVGNAAGIDGQGWYNEDGGDVEFLRAMLAHFTTNLCIDEARLFSTGFSFGGMMSNAVACEFADTFRAVAPMSGNLQGSGCNQVNDMPIAYLGIHGDMDDFVDTQGGRDARDIFIARNHCQSETAPTDIDVCVEYQGCDEGYPVIWCEWPGEHSIWPDSAEPVWAFFSQF